MIKLNALEDHVLNDLYLHKVEYVKKENLKMNIIFYGENDLVLAVFNKTKKELYIFDK